MGSVGLDLFHVAFVVLAFAVAMSVAAGLFALLKPHARRPAVFAVPGRFLARLAAAYAGCLAGMALLQVSGFGYLLGPDCARGSVTVCAPGTAQGLHRAEAIRDAVIMAICWAFTVELLSRVKDRPSAV